MHGWTSAGGADAIRSHLAHHPLPDALAALDPAPDSRFFVSGAGGRTQGGLFSLDSMHFSDTGYAVLANLFLHYAFDMWMVREYPTVPFERFADDAVVHCVSEGQARRVVAAIANRMVEVGLRLHPDKTRIVYCKDGKRRGAFEHTAFTFLGFTFRARAARGKNGRNFTSFLPAISTDALNKISGEVRRWRLHHWTGHTFGEVAKHVNPVVRGWMQYYGTYYRTALYPLLLRINAYLMRWIRRKYRRLRPFTKAQACWQRITGQHPRLFAHWAWKATSW